MDKAIFQFDSGKYTLEEVEKLTRNECENLCNTDEDNVTKFDISTSKSALQNLLNDNVLDTPLLTYRCWFRVFI